jgi:uncharacterized protein
MAEAALPPPLEPTQDERTMATLAHALQMIGGWIAPLVIFLIRRESRFVSFHALQALLLQIVHVIAMLVFVLGLMVMGLASFLHASGKFPNRPPTALFVVLPLFWIFMVGINITVVVMAIVYCIKAGRGEWAEYPVLGRLARRMLKMGPGGANRA